LHYVSDDERIAVAVNGEIGGTFAADYNLVDSLSTIAYYPEEDFARLKNG